MRTKLSNTFKKLGWHYKFVLSCVMPYQNIARSFEQIAQFVLTIYNMSYQRRLILYNLLNKFLTDISALLLHTCVHVCNSDNSITGWNNPKFFYSDIYDTTSHYYCMCKFTSSHLILHACWMSHIRNAHTNYWHCTSLHNRMCME